MPKIEVYTKQIIDEEYGFGLAQSVHFNLIMDEGDIFSLHNGYGILFPEGEINADNTIAPRGADKPFIFFEAGKYFIGCDCIDSEMNSCCPGKVYMWETSDFVNYKTIGYVSRASLFPQSPATGDRETQSPATGDRETQSPATGDRETQSPAVDEIEISDELAGKILKSIWKCTAYAKEWPKRKSAYDMEYPLIRGFADPVFFKWNGMWHMLATNDINGNIGLFMRRADSLDNLFADGCEISTILDYSAENHFIQTFWAPEWHIIGDVPYILFAVGAEQWAPQSHVMKYKGEGDIMDSASWDMPVRVRQKDGHFLCEDGITLDMTHFKAGGINYVVWSERYNIGTPLDSGSMLYIATIDESNPAVLTSDKVLLSRPLYGWENVDGTINNEGPYPLLRDKKVYLSYSGGAAVGHTYAVGYLIANEEDNLLNVSNWSKFPTALLNAYSVEGIDGPGHCSFFTDDRGDTNIAYHCQEDMRTATYHKVSFSQDGFPILDRPISHT